MTVTEAYTVFSKQEDHHQEGFKTTRQVVMATSARDAYLKVAGEPCEPGIEVIGVVHGAVTNVFLPSKKDEAEASQIATEAMVKYQKMWGIHREELAVFDRLIKALENTPRVANNYEESRVVKRALAKEKEACRVRWEAQWRQPRASSDEGVDGSFEDDS